MQFYVERYTVFILFLTDRQRIMSGIEQFEPLAAVGYAEAALFSGRSHDDRIAGCEVQIVAVRFDADEYVALLMSRHTVFERVLYKRDEDHRCDHGVRTPVAALDRKVDTSMVVHAVFLQLDVLADVIYFGAQGDPVLVGIGVHIFRHIHELHERRFGPRHVGQHQPVEGVQRIEEKMGVDLDFVESQFGFPLFVFRSLPFDGPTIQFGQRTYRKTERNKGTIRPAGAGSSDLYGASHRNRPGHKGGAASMHGLLRYFETVS